MYKKRTIIKNKTGLHARPAAGFVQAAAGFGCEITIRRTGPSDSPDSPSDDGKAQAEEEAVNAKSIIHLLSLGLNQGDEIEIAAEGDGEQEAVDALAALIETGFGE